MMEQWSTPLKKIINWLSFQRIKLHQRTCDWIANYVTDLFDVLDTKNNDAICAASPARFMQYLLNKVSKNVKRPTLNPQ